MNGNGSKRTDDAEITLFQLASNHQPVRLIGICRRYPLVISRSHGIDGPFIDGLPIKNGDFPWLC